MSKPMHPEERSQQCYGYCHLAFQFLNSKRIWKLTPSRIFSCKSFFNQLIDDYALLNFHMIWNAKVPNKVQPFAWLLALGKLSTGDGIQRRNLNDCCLLLGVSCAREMVKVQIICFCILIRLLSCGIRQLVFLQWCQLLGILCFQNLFMLLGKVRKLECCGNVQF